MGDNINTGDLVVATIFTNSEKSEREEVLAKVLRIIPGFGVNVQVVGLDTTHRLWGMRFPLKWEQVSL